MPVTVEGKIIRLACNQSSDDGVLDKWSEEPIVLWQGGTAQLQCTLFKDDPEESSLVNDLTGIVSATLLIRKHSPRGTLLISKTVLAVDMDDTVTYATFLDDSDQHFTFELTEEETNQVVTSSGVLPIYFSITVSTASSDYIAGFGYGRIVDVGVVDVGDPTPANFHNVYVNLNGEVQNEGDVDFATGQLKVNGVAIAPDGGGVWGTITGTLSSQTDLQGVLNAKQPLDSDLTAIAALTTTSFGRSFLDRADAAAGRTLLGLGTLATQSGTFSGTSSGTNTGDQDLSGYQTKAGTLALGGFGSITGRIGNANLPDHAITADFSAIDGTDQIQMSVAAHIGRFDLSGAAPSGIGFYLNGPNPSLSLTLNGTGTDTVLGTEGTDVYAALYEDAHEVVLQMGGGKIYIGDVIDNGNESVFAYANGIFAVQGTAMVIDGGISYTGVGPDKRPVDLIASGFALLDLRSTGVGFFEPRMTTTQRDAIGTNPSAEGLQVFNITTHRLNFFDGSAWQEIPIGDDTAYDATSWNGNTGVPTKNAVRDKIESIMAGTGLYGLTLAANQSVRRNAGNTAYEAFRAQDYDTDLTTWAGITPGTGVGTALATNVGSAGAFVTFNGALGTPSSGVATNLTGIPAGQLTGSIADARLSANVPLLNAANTFTLNQVNSYSGTASTPAMKYSGVPFAGTGTTSFPLVYINDANATASTTLNTAGTYFGVNGDGTQDLMNLLKDGTSQFKVSSAGAVTAIGQIQSGAGNVNTPGVGVGGNQGFFSSSGLAVTDGSNRIAQWGATSLRILSGCVFGFSSDASNAFTAADTGLARNAAGVVEINNGTAGTYRDLKLRNVVGQSGYSEMAEMTAPGAGAANTARIYAEDNGSGKTRLMVIFPSGAAQQIAIEA